MFWDFDGTLADRPGRWAGALVDAARVVDPTTNVTVEQVRPSLGSGFPWHQPEVVRPATSPSQWRAELAPVFVRAYRAAGMPDDLAERAAAQVRVEYYRPESWQLRKGAVEALTLVRRAGFRSLILSNHGPELPWLVTQLGMGDLIEQTLTSAVVGAEKPNRLIFEAGLRAAERQLGDRPWLVGDNPVADIAGAEAMGWRTLLVGDEALTLQQAATMIVTAR